MIWIGIFLGLSLIEGIYVWTQWNKISQVVEAATFIQGYDLGTSLNNISNQYDYSNSIKLDS